MKTEYFELAKKMAEKVLEMQGFQPEEIEKLDLNNCYLKVHKAS